MERTVFARHYRKRVYFASAMLSHLGGCGFRYRLVSHSWIIPMQLRGTAQVRICYQADVMVSGHTVVSSRKVQSDHENDRKASRRVTTGSGCGGNCCVVGIMHIDKTSGTDAYYF